MPSAGQISFVYDQTRMRWMTSLTSGRFQPPLNLTEGNTIDFVFRLSNNGVLFTPALTPVWIFGIKDADDPNGDFLIQVNSATAASGVFTFVVELASAELQAWLATATSQSYAAIQITDSANDIATGPLLCQIAPNQNDSGTTPTSANGTLSVAAGKTVTFPQSLTFPSALGTNGFQLTTDGAGALTWATAGISGITIGTTTANGTAGRVLYTDGALVQQYAISGTGSVAMTNTPTLVTPVLGAATATSINGIPIYGDATALGIDMTAAGGALDTSAGGGNISTSTNGGSINTSSGGGSIDTTGTGSIELGVTGTRTTFTGAASGSNKSIALPNLSGTVVVTAATSATATQALFAQATGFPAYRAIATADIATALTTPGPIGGTTASTGAFTTVTLPVNSTNYVPTLNLGGNKGLIAETNYVTVVNGSAYIMAFNAGGSIVNCDLIANPTNSRSCGTTVGRWSNVFSVLGNFSGAVTCSTTLAVSSTTTMTGLLTANGGITLGNAQNIAFNTTTGTKIGAATTQKLSFWDATPIVQPTTAVASATVAHIGGGINLKTDDTFDGYTIAQVVKALRNAGLLA